MKLYRTRPSGSASVRRGPPNCPALLEQAGYMESIREFVRLKNGMLYVGGAIRTTHIPYFPNHSGELWQD